MGFGTPTWNLIRKGELGIEKKCVCNFLSPSEVSPWVLLNGKQEEEQIGSHLRCK